MTPELQQTGAAPATSGATSKDIDDFIYLISHDVRASVRALLELPQWIAEDLEEAGFKMEGPVATSIDMMNRHTGRLDRMLVDLLTFSRVGRMQNVSEVHLGEVLDQVLDAMIMPAGFTVIRSLACDRLTIGERDILTLFDSVIQNAVKHHDQAEGQINVTSSLVDGVVTLTVTDDGPGILPEFHEKVFGAMTTLRPRDEVEGSGMGLANVRRIATHYGGTAQLLPMQGGRGCQVEVCLPQ